MRFAVWGAMLGGVAVLAHGGAVEAQSRPPASVAVKIGALNQACMRAGGKPQAKSYIYVHDYTGDGQKDFLVDEGAYGCAGRPNLFKSGGAWTIDPQLLKSPVAPTPTNVTNTEALGLVLYTKYIHYFQLAGLVLLVAMIGAIVLTLRHKPNVKRQDIPTQNARTKAAAMEIRKVASGQGLPDAVMRDDAKEAAR